MGIQVYKVTVVNKGMADFLRPLVANSNQSWRARNSAKAGVVIDTNHGHFYGRLDDFTGQVKFAPSLNPDNVNQGFVNQRITSGVAQILEEQVLSAITANGGNVEARFHHYLTADALKKEYATIIENPINFEELTFGLNASDVMAMFTIPKNGDWSSLDVSESIYPYENFPISPAAQILHYAQGIFEGGKAYRYADGSIVSFRLHDNAVRFAKSATRLNLTPVPEELFLAAIRATVMANKHLIAPPGMGCAMYIRPYHFGSGPQLGVAPAPSETFGVFVSPVGPYFKRNEEGEAFTGQRMKIETIYKRSSFGLSGDVKVDANYAGSILPGVLGKLGGHVRTSDVSEAGFKALVQHGYINEHGIMKPFNNQRASLDLHGAVSPDEEKAIFKVLTKKAHFAEVIYLNKVDGEDPNEKDILDRELEEVGAANAFFVKDGVLYTPALGTILPGITRDSVITLARDMGLKVVDDQKLTLRMLLDADEVFCTGTAAVITPISSISLNDFTAIIGGGAVGATTRKLYDTLTGIQEGRLPDPYGWVTRIEVDDPNENTVAKRVFPVGVGA